MTIDDLIRQMQDDERKDKADTATKLTPIEFARVHGMTPQKVYQHLRRHRTHETCDNHLELVECDCSRMVLDVKAAKKYFGIGETPVSDMDIPEGEIDYGGEPGEFGGPEDDEEESDDDEDGPYDDHSELY